MKLTSKSFKDNHTIPRRFTCEGDDLSPPLEFHDVPKNAVTLALIVQDPDAPHGTFDHWIGWNLDPKIERLDEGEALAFNGVNGYGDTKYHGPCPPRGKPHHYIFSLFALDCRIELSSGATKAELIAKMHGHIIEEATLIGLYERL